MGRTSDMLEERFAVIDSALAKITQNDVLQAKRSEDVAKAVQELQAALKRR